MEQISSTYSERISSISTFAKFLAMRTPTNISAGAVAHDGMIFATGLRKRHTAKQSAVTKLVSPVLPPAAIPEADSTNVVHVDVQRSGHSVGRNRQGHREFHFPLLPIPCTCGC